MNTNRLFTSLPCFILALFVFFVLPAKAEDSREKELLAILRSDSPASEKAIACKLLAIHGTSEGVPELAKLLFNPQLSSWSRISLEAIPGEAADEALRKATSKLQGKLLVGTINSIGVRQDAEAVELLTKHLQDKSAEVASAAAVALGHIGNEPAINSLRQSLVVDSLKVRSAVAEGCILSAERLLSDGNISKAINLYDEVRKATLPKQRILEATRGAILARNEEGIPLLIELFRSQDKKMFQLALTTAREFPGNQVDKALAIEMAQSTPDRAALMIQAMADRTETVVLEAVLFAAEQSPKQVRLAAINALARIGDSSCLSALLEIAVEEDADVVLATKKALADLPGEKVNTQIVSLIPKADEKIYPLLIELVGHRRIDAVSELLKGLDHSNRAVRSAALSALGETVALDGLDVLISQVIAPKHSEDAGVAQQALMAASVRMPDREACAEKLTAAIKNSSSVATKVSLLQIIGAVGGTKALATVGTAARDAIPELQDTSSQLLGKWMTVDAAPVLLDLSKTAPTEKYQIRALRGYIRIARQFRLPAKQRIEMCQEAFEAAKRPAEKQLVFEILKRYPSVPSLRLAMNAMEVPELKQGATEAALVIAQKLDGRGNDVRELLLKSGLERIKLEIVKAEYGAGSTQKDVTALLRKYAGDLPLITLDSKSYNASFGGDPVPGNVKRLTIQYRINGKAGEASFAENSLILLPMPK